MTDNIHPDQNEYDLKCARAIVEMADPATRERYAEELHAWVDYEMKEIERRENPIACRYVYFQAYVAARKAAKATIKRAVRRFDKMS